MIAKGWRTLALVLVGFGLQQNIALAQQRTWTDTTGAYKIEAVLVEVLQTDNGLQAQFVRADGQKMEILVSKLCEADAAAASEFFKKAAESKTKSTNTVSEMPPEKADAPSVADPAAEQSGLPVEQLTSRPLTAPINIARTKLDNQVVTPVNFDPSTAVRLERDIKRDSNGKPIENPVYLVDLQDSELRLLPQKFKDVVDQIRDPNLAIDKKRLAIESLTKSWPNGRHPGLLKALVNALSHKDKFLRLTALDLLANHDSDQSLIYILARIDDVSFNVRWRAFEILTQIRDPRVIPELVERLDSPDRTKAASVLQVFGNASAPLVQELIKVDGDEDVLLSVSQLLGNIGDQNTITALKVLENHESLLVRAQAKNSVKRITRRLEEAASKANTQR